MREAREQRFKERRVPGLSDIPADVMTQLANSGSDLGLGSKGRRLVARHKLVVEKKEAAEEKVLSRKKRTAFNAINFDRWAGVWFGDRQARVSSVLS